MNNNNKQIEQFEKDWANRIGKLRRAILRSAILGLLGYAVQDKRTSFTVSNINNSLRVSARVRREGKRARKGLLGFLVDSLLDLFGRNQKFYQEEGSTQAVDEAARKRILLLYGYDVDKKQVIPGGYIDETLNLNGVAQQVGNILNQQLATRATLSSMRTALRAALGGKSNLIDGHFRRFTRDLFAEYDRAVKFEYKERLGFKHGLYSGGLIDTSRDFCEKRVNNIYTEEEIYSWDDLVWKGKKIGVPVVVALGGHGPCRHHLVWVSEGTAKVVAKKVGGFNQYN